MKNLSYDVKGQLSAQADIYRPLGEALRGVSQVVTRGRREAGIREAAYDRGEEMVQETLVYQAALFLGLVKDLKRLKDEAREVAERFNYLLDRPVDLDTLSAGDAIRQLLESIFPQSAVDFVLS